MKYILLAAAIVLVCAFGYVVFVLLDGKDTSVSTHEIFPDSPIMDRGSQPIPNNGQAGEASSTFGVVPGVRAMSQWERDVITKIINTAQPMPGDDQSTIYDTVQAETFNIQVVLRNETDYTIRFLLTKAPLYEARQKAEQAFVALFDAERDDICGFPIVVTAPQDHPLASVDNLGLEQCGTSKITETD